MKIEPMYHNCLNDETEWKSRKEISTLHYDGVCMDVWRVFYLDIKHSSNLIILNL